MGAADDLVKQLLAKKKGKTVQPVAPAKKSAVPESEGALQKICTNPVQAVAPDTALPVVRATASLTVPDLKAPAIPAARKFLRTAPAAHSDKDRALRDEKVMFVRLVEECKAAERLSDQMAVLRVVSSNPDSFPLLTVAGKKGKSALHYNNLRNWRDGNAKRPGLRDPLTGKIDYSREDLLLSNYGCTKKRYGDDRFWTALFGAVNNLAENQISKSYRLLVREWMKHSPNAEIPSLSMVYTEIRKMPKRLLDLNRKGTNWYLQHCRDYNERDPESIKPMEGWVGDTQMLDFMIRVDTGKVDENGQRIFEAVRPWICVIMDIKSEHVISWEMGIGSINSKVIRNAFGRGVWQYGRPFIFLTDNGKDYKKAGFTTPVVFTPDVANSVVYQHSILLALDIEYRKATAYNGRAKIVERFFSEMAKYYRTRRGYVGNCPANRPASADVWAKPVTNEYLMNIREACDSMYDFIDMYHNTPATGSKFLNGKTPEEAFAGELRVKRPVLSMSELYRRFLMPETTPRIVNACGSSVHVNNHRYVTLRQDREKMWKYDGKAVMVKFDLASSDYCFLFDLDGTFLTVAHRPQQLPYFCRTPEEKALLAQHQEWINSEITTLNTYTTDLTRDFHKLDVATSFGLPPEEFEDRAKLAKVGTKHSVKGETHNPAVYVPAPERKAMLLSRGEDIKKICTEKVHPVTPKIPESVQTTEMKKLNSDLVDFLTGNEENSPVAVDAAEIYNNQNEEKQHENFNPYDI